VNPAKVVLEFLQVFIIVTSSD